MTGTTQPTTPATLAAEILTRITADPDAFAPGLGGFATVCSHAVWPEDDIDGGDTQMGIAGWACHLSGWKLSTDDCNAAWAFVDEDWEQRRNPLEVAAELLGLDTTSLLEDPDRDAALAGLRAVTERSA